MRNAVGGLMLTLVTFAITNCGNGSPVSPTGPGGTTLTSLQSTATPVERPLNGTCVTTFSPAAPGAGDVCEVFEPVPSAVIAIAGLCQITHLGRTDWQAVQQLIFQLDAGGQPVIIGGQPVLRALRNCSTLTAANGDQLRHTAIGEIRPGNAPGEVAFDGTLTFTGGTGRFASASGSATASGVASLITSTGSFSMNGRVIY